jgi:hypothetical protein
LPPNRSIILLPNDWTSGTKEDYPTWAVSEVKDND